MILIVLLLLSLAAPTATLARPPLRAEAVLITIGPGDEVWEKFGHDMLWIDDPDRHLSAAYNWGLFDFDAPNFVGNFILGRMTYSMDAFEPHEAMVLYLQQKRQVTMQRLDITDAEIDKLIDLCETNRLPRNRDYRYDYFKDNCSTRPRDLIDQATGGRFSRECAATAKASGLSYRQHALRLMRGDFWMSFGIDFCLGPACDPPLTAWQECFLPTRLAAFAAPMASDTWTPWPSDRAAEPQAVPNRAPWTALAGIGIAALMLLTAKWRDWAGRWLASLWLFVSGLAGWFLLFVWTCTDHWAAHANQNLLHYSPLAWIALALLIFRRRPWAAKTMMIVVVVSLFALLLKCAGVLTQQNGTYIPLALPLNLAAIAVLRRPRLTPAAQPSEVIAS